MIGKKSYNYNLSAFLLHDFIITGNRRWNFWLGHTNSNYLYPWCIACAIPLNSLFHDLIYLQIAQDPLLSLLPTSGFFNDNCQKLHAFYLWVRKENGAKETTEIIPLHTCKSRYMSRLRSMTYSSRESQTLKLISIKGTRDPSSSRKSLRLSIACMSVRNQMRSTDFPKP